MQIEEQKSLKNFNTFGIDCQASYFISVNSVEDLKRFNIDNDYCYIAGLAHKDPQNYGVLHVDDNSFLKKIIEKSERLHYGIQ